MLIKIDSKSQAKRVAVHQRNLSKTERKDLITAAKSLIEFLTSKGIIKHDVEIKGNVTVNGTPYFIMKSDNKTFGAYRLFNGKSIKMKAAFVPRVQEAMWNGAEAL